MNYPIEAEACIAAMQREFGLDAAAEEVYQEVIPLINEAPAAGLHNAGGLFPPDLEEEQRAFAAELGKPLETVKANRLPPPLIARTNKAYERGRSVIA